MDIPYTTKPRPDTGLYNAKVGIWLFLASEVMLFGALFSSYVLLRVGAPPGTWISGVLNVPIGTVNTLVLIASSVTVVMAWASLKMNKYKHFQIYQTATVVCALIFVIIKSFEYKDKWTHYEVWLTPEAVEKYEEHLKENYDGTPANSITGHFEIDGSTPFFWTHKTLEEKGLDHIEFIPSTWEHGNEHVAHHAEGEDHALHVSSEEIDRMSAYVPAHSPYFAMYFTLTGLHALHVIGGAIVMAYLLIFGRKLWEKDPERQTNRIEVSGLFWHFVDLVWIFLFPVLYLL